MQRAILGNIKKFGTKPLTGNVPPVVKVFQIEHEYVLAVTLRFNIPFPLSLRERLYTTETIGSALSGDLFGD